MSVKCQAASQTYAIHTFLRTRHGTVNNNPIFSVSTVDPWPILPIRAVESITVLVDALMISYQFHSPFLFWDPEIHSVVYIPRPFTDNGNS